MATTTTRPRQAVAAAPTTGFGPRRSRARGRHQTQHSVERRPGGLRDRQRVSRHGRNEYDDDDGNDIINPHARPDVGSDYHDWTGSLREPSPATSESSSSASRVTVRHYPPSTTYPGNQTDELAVGWKFETSRFRMTMAMVGDVLPLKPNVPYTRTRLYFDRPLQPAYYVLRSNVGEVSFVVNYHWGNPMRCMPLPDPRRGSHDAVYEVLLYDTTTRPCMLLMHGTLGDELANATWEILDPRSDNVIGNVTVSGTAFYR